MLARINVKVELKKAGVYLSAKTKKARYGKCYNTVYPEADNYMPTIDTAIKDFLAFCNDCESN